MPMVQLVSVITIYCNSRAVLRLGLFPIVLSVLPLVAADFEVVRQYELPPEEVEVVYPLDVDCDAKGNVVLLEGHTQKVHLWSADGRFKATCGGKGQGPGEVNGLIRIALGQDSVYGFQYPGPIMVWPRTATGFESPNKVRRLRLKVPFAQVFQVFRHSDGGERLLLGGQERQSDGKGSMTWRIIDPNTSTVFKWSHLEERPVEPIWDLFSADGTQDLRVCQPRLWAAQVDSRQIMLGFSEQQRFHVVSPVGKILKSFKVRLPTPPPSDEEVKAFRSYSIPMILKSLDELGISIGIDKDQPKAAYSFFVPLDGDRILFINSIFGGFNNVNYVQSGDSYLVFDRRLGDVAARGKLEMGESDQLFPKDRRLIRTRFDDEDRLILEEVALRGNQ